MKFLCPRCDRLSTLELFRVEEGTLFVLCGGCQAESSVSPAAAPSARAPSPPAPSLLPASAEWVGGDPAAVLKAEVPNGFCPKCLAVRPPQALSCPQCGLTFSSFAAENFSLSPELTALWAQAVQADFEPARHEVLAERARQTGELPLVARLYRIRLAVDPDDAVARQGLERVVLLASQPSALASDRATVNPERRQQMVVGVSLFVFLGLLVLAVKVILQVARR